MNMNEKHIERSAHARRKLFADRRAQRDARREQELARRKAEQDAADAEYRTEQASDERDERGQAKAISMENAAKHTRDLAALASRWGNEPRTVTGLLFEAAQAFNKVCAFELAEAPHNRHIALALGEASGQLGILGNEDCWRGALLEAAGDVERALRAGSGPALAQKLILDLEVQIDRTCSERARPDRTDRARTMQRYSTQAHMTQALAEFDTAAKAAVPLSPEDIERHKRVLEEQANLKKKRREPRERLEREPLLR